MRKALVATNLQQTVRTCYALTSNINMASSVQTLIDTKIKGKKVMVFSKSYCPYCSKAKTVFQDLVSKGQLSTEDYEVMEIEDDPNCNAIQKYLGTLTGASSVPRVFINGSCVGGGDDVVSKYKSGQLIKLLQ